MNRNPADCVLGLGGARQLSANVDEAGREIDVGLLKALKLANPDAGQHEHFDLRPGPGRAMSKDGA